MSSTSNSTKEEKKRKLSEKGKKPADTTTEPELRKKKKSQRETEEEKELDLMQLAREQRFNTDIRRSIFCVIMGAEDYMDAFEKINKLKLTKAQIREVVRVIIDCSRQEKQYNPYYSLLATRLCLFCPSEQLSRIYRFSFRIQIWDQCQDIQSTTSEGAEGEGEGEEQGGGISKTKVQAAYNLGHFLAHLVAKGALNLSILKKIDFKIFATKKVNSKPHTNYPPSDSDGEVEEEGAGETGTKEEEDVLVSSSSTVSKQGKQLMLIFLNTCFQSLLTQLDDTGQKSQPEQKFFVHHSILGSNTDDIDGGGKKKKKKTGQLGLTDIVHLVKDKESFSVLRESLHFFLSSRQSLLLQLYRSLPTKSKKIPEKTFAQRLKKMISLLQ